ncbi:hypothetical protein [Lentilactobacillus hilgardii]|uniref:hypothetical protein n=1 Tax=Lentilactobacillus hilgardii TaxID=1588 RepID=UPI00390C4176
MILLLAIVIIWATYKFFTSWIWWILGIMLLIALWRFLTSWPVLLLIAGTCIFLLIKQRHDKAQSLSSKVNKG